MDGFDGVDPELAWYIRQVQDIVRTQAPGLALVVTSGYRSPEYQAQLRARWDRGNRAGLVTRPAAASQHSRGLAVDLGWIWRGNRIPSASVPRAYWQFLASILEPVGVRWGGRFTPPDIVHFEIKRLAA